MSTESEINTSKLELHDGQAHAQIKVTSCTGCTTNVVATLRHFHFLFQHVQKFNQRRHDGNSVPLGSDMTSKNNHTR